MKEALIDTDILSYFFRDEPKVVAKFKDYLDSQNSINISIVTYYEILSGLEHLKAHGQIDEFENFVNSCRILNLTRDSVKTSAEKYGELKRKGVEIGNSDLLIAGIALSHNFVLVTNNERHFGQISGLLVENWAK